MSDVSEKYLGKAERSEQEAKHTRHNSFYVKLTSAFTVVAVVSTIPAFTTILGKSLPFFYQPISQSVAAQAKSEAELGKLRLEIAQVRSDLTHLNVTLSDVGTEVPTAVAINNIAGRLAEVEKKQTALDQIILDNPQKALELPLLKRDVETVKQSNDQAIASVKQSVDQVYDLNKWLLGSMAVGVLCLALSHFFRRKAD